MKREIKFRGKRLNNGEWVYGSLVIYKDICLIYTGRRYKNDNSLERFEVDPETVGEYTGLKDCKRTEEYLEGQEIYEGDIVFFDYNESYWIGIVGEFRPLSQISVKVLWHCTDYSNVPDNKKRSYAINSKTKVNKIFYCDNWYHGLLTHDLYKTEVIGSIHENPELL